MNFKFFLITFHWNEKWVGSIQYTRVWKCPPKWSGALYPSCTYDALCVHIALIFLTIWITATKSKRQSEITHYKRRSISQSIKFLFENQLCFLVTACCFMGIIKEGLSLWTSMLFYEAVCLGLSDSLSALLITPLANFCGIFTSNRLHKLIGGDNHLKPVMLLLLAVISVMSYWCNTIILALIRLKLSTDNMASLLVGILDFSTYVGAAILSVLTW